MTPKISFKISLFLSVLLLMCCYGLPLSAQPGHDLGASGEAEGVVIPLRYDPPFVPFIVVQVRINGHAPLPFVVDTGLSAPLIVDTGAAKQLQLRPNRLRAMVNGSVELIGASLTTVRLVGQKPDDGQDCIPTSVYLLNLHLLNENHVGPRFAGLIGAPLLSQFVVRFDFVQQSMTLFSPGNAPPKAEGATTAPLVGRDESHSISVSPQEGVRVRVVVDTGALGSSVPLTVAPYLHPLATTLSQYQQLGFTIIGDRWRLATYQIGDFQEQDVAVNGAPEFAYSVLGLDLLSRFRVTLDFPRGSLTLERAQNYAQRAHLPGWTGIELEANGHTFRVRSVEQHSAAAVAGVAPGSEILAVDSHNLENLPFTVAENLLNGYAGTQATLSLRHAGRALTIVCVRGTEFDGPHGAVTGMTLEKRESGPLFILRVAAGSTPDLAGLVARDEILTVNGTGVANLTADEAWQRLHGRKVTVTARRKGVPRPIHVTLIAPSV